MPQDGPPTLFFESHCYEHKGLVTLWFYKSYDPDGPDPLDDPHALRLVGPTSPGECHTVAKAIKLVFQRLGLVIREESGADD